MYSKYMVYEMNLFFSIILEFKEGTYQVPRANKQGVR